jgi:hypothetical protein
MSIGHGSGRARKYILAAATALILAHPGLKPEAFAQDATKRDLPATLISIVSNVFNISYITPNATLSSFRYQGEKEPQVVPNDFLKDKSFAIYLNRYQKVPNTDQSLPTGEAGTIISRLGKLDGDVEFSSPKEVDKNKDTIKKAKALLFQPDTEIPSNAYNQYLDFQKRVQDEIEKLKAESNPSTITVMKISLQQLQKDWELFGRKYEIEAALLVLAGNGQDKVADMYKDWLKNLNSNQDFVAKSITTALYKGEWTRISLSDTELADVNLSLDANGNNQDLPRLRRLSFDTALVPLTFTPMNHPFLASKSWRTKSGYSISDGTGVDSDDELVPRLVSHLLIVKNLELTFDKKIPDDVLETLADSKTLKLASITIENEKSATPAFQDQMITVSSPMIVGYAIANVAKIPNPSAGNQWKSEE